jgi:hypothetical protein
MTSPVNEEKYWIIYTDKIGKLRQGIFGEVDFKNFMMGDPLEVYTGSQNQVDLLMLLKDGHISEKVKQERMKEILERMVRIK